MCPSRINSCSRRQRNFTFIATVLMPYCLNSRTCSIWSCFKREININIDKGQVGMEVSCILSSHSQFQHPQDSRYRSLEKWLPVTEIPAVQVGQMLLPENPIAVSAVLYQSQNVDERASSRGNDVCILDAFRALQWFKCMAGAIHIFADRNTEGVDSR